MNTGKVSAPALVSVWICIGPERWLARRTIERLKAEFLTPGFEEVDFLRLAEPPEDSAGIVEAAGTAPFGSKKRLIVLEGFDELQEEDLPWLEEVLRCPGCLVLTAQKVSPSLQKKLLSLQEKGRVKMVLCQPLKGFELSQWVGEEAKRIGLEITSQAQQLLIARVGSNLQALEGSLESLFLLAGLPAEGSVAGRGAKVTPLHVESLIAPTVKETAFDILDSAAAGKPEVAVGLLNQALSQGKLTLEQFFAALGWYYRMLFKAKVNPASSGWMNPSRQAAVSRAQRWPLSRFEAALNQVLEVEVGVKLSRPALHGTADWLILRLGSPDPTAGPLVRAG